MFSQRVLHHIDVHPLSTGRDRALGRRDLRQRGAHFVGDVQRPFPRLVVPGNHDIHSNDLERYRKVNLSDRTMWANTTVVFARQLYNMLQLARVIAQGARMRDESRGAHYKPDFPDRDDKNWLKTTKAYFAPDADEPKFEFEPVDVSLIPPRARKY